MRAGRLHQVLTIQQPTEPTNILGEITDGWSTFATVRGSVEPAKGDEQLQAAQIEARLAHLVRIRFLAGLTVKMRVKVDSWDNRLLKIHSIADIEARGHEMELLCSEVV